MRTPRQSFAITGIPRLVPLMLVLSCQFVNAETVYKCVKDGKVSYTSNPPAADGECQETIIRDDGPNPADLARLLEEKRLREAEERMEKEADLREREIRAREIEAQAASRRARAAEELLLLQQPRLTPAPEVGYPLTYPYWWGGTVVLPQTHPGFGGARPPIHHNIPPSTPPKPEPVRPTGAVRLR